MSGLSAWEVPIRREQEQRFKRALLTNPDLTLAALAERFGINPREAWRWCKKLGLPLPPTDDLRGMARWSRSRPKKRKATR